MKILYAGVKKTTSFKIKTLMCVREPGLIAGVPPNAPIERLGLGGKTAITYDLCSGICN